MRDRRQGERRRAVAGATSILAQAERFAADDPVEWLGAGAATHYLGLPSRKALYQAVRRGQVPVHRLGPRRMRFRRVELDEVLERGRQSLVLQSS